MILMDTEGNVYTDEGTPVSDSMKEALVASGACLLRSDSAPILYRRGIDGDLTVYSILGPKYMGVRLSLPDIYFFKKLGQVTTVDAHLIDIGGETVRAYLTEGVFDIPRELICRD